MCRLSALTTTNLAPVMKRLFWHQLMLASNADGQRDGTGMTDGVNTYKSWAPFVDYGSEWVGKLTPDSAWLGHVRSASRNTELSSRSAHPFLFMLGANTRFYAAHNGGITDMPPTLKHEPRVDSYAAFKLLVDMVPASSALTPEIINEWTRMFGWGSEYAFMFHHLGAITAVRGNRALHYMQVGNGIMCNTSADVLLHVKEWIMRYWGAEYSVGKIMDIKENHMFTLSPGSTDVVLLPINAVPSDPTMGMYYRDDAMLIEQYTKR